MRAATLSDLLKAGDRIAVSNITGREASTVAVTSQKYCRNIVAGWALGKGGTSIDVPGGEAIPVFSGVEDMFRSLPRKKQPNKIIVYSPPPAVYGEVKGMVEHGKNLIETLYVITEHVSIEVTAKIAQLCSQANIDVLGCNTLGMINTHDSVRVGAVGGDQPQESFRPGSATIISNSGNMVNTMASYLQSAGLGNSYGISTGKDTLILMPLKNLLELARNDERTRLIVLYIEPGGLYEAEAVKMLRETQYPKPIIAYIAGELLTTHDISLGHAGAVVEGGETTAAAKKKLFDEYFGIAPFSHDKHNKSLTGHLDAMKRGIRIETLHHLPAAAKLICDTLGIQRDFPPRRALRLNPWFVDWKGFGKQFPSSLVLHPGTIHEPYGSQVKRMTKSKLGAKPSRRNMRNTSNASSNDGRVTRLHHRSLEEQMREGAFVKSLLLAWTGREVHDFDVKLVEQCLIASLTNGPGTISAQAAKLSTSAGNAPNTAMIATLACIGEVHGGNGRRAVDYLLRIFADVDLQDPYDPKHNVDLQMLVDKEVERFRKARSAAKDAGTDYERIPCLGHPVFKGDPVNYDPRERVIADFIKDSGLCNIFLDFYHLLATRLKEVGIARNVWAVNLDAAIAAVTLGFCWKQLLERQMTVQRAKDIAFAIFATGRVAGSVGEFLDHQDFGLPMDMRIPVSECIALSKPKN